MRRESYYVATPATTLLRADATPSHARRRSPWVALSEGVHDPMFVPAVAVTALQLLAVLCRHDGSLPFSCVPMFKLPRRLDDALPKSATITCVLRL